jgi:dephospho-CoA kinase
VKLLMIVGQAGAGKSTVGEILKRHNYTVIEAGDIIRERFAREGMLDETILSFAERLLETEGYDLHVNRIVDILYNQTSSNRSAPFAVVVGLRTPLQIRRLSEYFAEAYAVAIYASAKMRFRRIKKRRRSDDPDSFIDFLREDFRELAWGLDKVLYEASYYIFNEGTLVKLEQQVFSLPFLYQL